MPRATQNPTHRGFVALDAPYDCGQCVARHAADYQFPPLLPENAEVQHLFCVLAGQMRGGGFTVGPIDLLALPVAFDLYHVPHDERVTLFEKLLICDTLAREHRERQQAQQTAQREAERHVAGMS